MDWTKVKKVLDHIDETYSYAKFITYSDESGSIEYQTYSGCGDWESDDVIEFQSFEELNKKLDAYIKEHNLQ